MTTTIVQNRKKYSHKHTHSLTHKCVLIILYAKYKNSTRHKIAHANITLQWPRKAQNCTKMKQNQTKQNFAYFSFRILILLLLFIFSILFSSIFIFELIAYKQYEWQIDRINDGMRWVQWKKILYLNICIHMKC